MKASVGVMLTSFGVFFVGEGIGVDWWHADVSILLLVALFAALFVVCTWLLPAPAQRAACRDPSRAVVAEIWGLVVGAGLARARRDRGGARCGAPRRHGSPTRRGWAALLLVGGVVLALLIAVAESRRPVG